MALWLHDMDTDEHLYIDDMSDMDSTPRAKIVHKQTVWRMYTYDGTKYVRRFDSPELAIAKRDAKAYLGEDTDEE